MPPIPWPCGCSTTSREPNCRRRTVVTGVEESDVSEPTAQRTLVKSPPELWAEISDVASLAKHLGEFGEIRITRIDPETTVAWEGDRASGTVTIEPSGWGTKVTLTATPREAPPEPEPPAVAESIPSSPPEGAPGWDA